MSHYDWFYEDYTCDKCKKQKLDYDEVNYINEYVIKRNPNLKLHEGKYLCKECEEVLKNINIEIVDLSVYEDIKLEFPKENEVVRVIDKYNNIDFQAKITKVKKGKTCLDTTLEIERLN